VCVQLQEGDDPEALGLEVGTLPAAATRACAPHRRAAGRLPSDRATFERLSQRPDRDRSRPGIEFYRRRDVIDLLLPVV
jgi:hypothetical protein